MSVRPVLLTTALAVGLSPLVVAPGPAAAAAEGVVISEVYGGGGAATSVWGRDWVELHNPTGSEVSLDGASVQYRSASGTGNPSGVTALSGAIEPGGYYLVGLGTGTAGEPVGPVDASGTTQLSGSAGTVFLADQATALTAPAVGSVAQRAGVVDLVGYGASNTFEGSAAVQPSNATTLARDAAGTDSQDNAADFTAGEGTPGEAPGETGPEPEPTALTIAQVQGTGASSPVVGQRVTTTGVVTAAYPTGGLDGFFLQTAGTGGVTRPAGAASDGVFVKSLAGARQVAIGDHVEVTGTVAEEFGLTQIGAQTVTALPAGAGVTPTAVTWPRESAAKESLEGMLLAPQGRFTVADNYSTNRYAEIGLAAGDTPLLQPTEVANPVSDPAAVAAVRADNAARAVTLDDGASTDYLSVTDQALPYLTQQPAIRVGAPARLTRPVVLHYAFGDWRFQPTAPLTGSSPLPVRVDDTRQSRPERVAGGVSVASFNVLNYFTTTGADFERAGGSCDFYADRVGDPVTTDTCTGPGGRPGPRGAAESEDLQRQERKLAAAINALDADVVGIEEIENSARFGDHRDESLRQLVEVLNKAAGRKIWSFVPTPRGLSTAASQADEDVIRTAFIYQRSAVRPVGASLIHDVAAFDNARDPLAQAFVPRKGRAQDRFLAVVNHFKSKGSGVPGDGDEGQGASNKARTAAARSLVDFTDDVAAQRRTSRVFLLGDFNSYSAEDPMQVLYSAGYASVGTRFAAGEHTYLYEGQVGSLDHVLGNRAAMRTVRGADVWNVNSVESVALEYSRHNYNLTDFYRPDAFRASDHDPLKVGFTVRR